MQFDFMSNQALITDTVKVHDLEFELLLSPEEISDGVDRIASDVSRDFAGKTPLCLAVLNGAFMFMADFVRALSFDPEITFVKVSSYKAMQSSGEVEKLIGLNADLKDREVIVIEDIVDSGHTIAYLDRWLKSHGASKVIFAALLYKEDAYKYDIPITYTGFTIPDRFVVGYGLDYNGYGRSLPGVYVLRPNQSID